MIAAAKAVELQEQEEQTKMEEELAKAHRANKRRTADFEMDEMAEPMSASMGLSLSSGASMDVMSGEDISVYSGASRSLRGQPPPTPSPNTQDPSSTGTSSPNSGSSGSGSGGGDAASGVDLTQIPKLLDARFAQSRVSYRYLMRARR